MANMPSSFLQSSASGAASYQAAAQAGPLADVNELFAGLLPMSWRGIQFPIIETELDLRQDLAVHKFVDLDGAHVEATGRAPLQITARIPFLNGLSRGKAEQWLSPLYPGEWRKFFAACADKSSGIVQHPELGDITCKCEHANTRWTSDVRLGVYVQVTWIETFDPDINVDLALASSSPLANAQAAAADLDAQLTELSPSVTKQILNLNSAASSQLTGSPFSPAFSFSDLMRSIRGVVDQTTLMQKQFQGRTDNFIYQVQALEDSINSATNASALNWPIIAAAELAKSACYDIKATVLNKGRKMGLFVTRKDSTMSQIAATIGAPLGDIMSLNPALVQFPCVAAGSTLRYYLQAA